MKGGLHFRGIRGRDSALGLALAALCGLPGVAMGQVDGYVVDATSRLPLEGVRVSLRASGDFVTTGANGRFSLPDAHGFLLVVTAAHVGYYTGTTTITTTPVLNREIALEPVPQDDNPDYVFKDPTTCSLCHIVQLEQWSRSPMALAGQNEWTYDIYDGSGTRGGQKGFVYTRDSVHAGVNPASECAACHQPERWIAAPHVALEDRENLSLTAIHGVSCEVCHKIANIDEARKNAPGIYPGVVTVTRPFPSSGPVMYGVLGDVDYHVSTMRASYQPQLTAAVCCACHQDKNDPDDDGDFEEENGIVSEPTYNEWLATPYGDPDSPLHATCVACHMPAYGDSQVCRVVPIKRPSDKIRSHRIEGTTPRFLESAVTMTLDVDASRPESLQVRVTLHNTGAGHHVPTGVSIRNMILLVEARELETGEELLAVGEQRVHELGGVGRPEQGDYAGLPGKLYAKITAGPDGTEPVFFTEAVRVVSDTRIPALASDETQYVFLRTSSTRTVQVRARLIYRRAWRSLVLEKNWTRTGHGEPLADVAAPHFGHLMEEAVWSSRAAYVQSLVAENTDQAVRVTWDVVASLRDLQGFRLLRSLRNGPPELLHEGLLPYAQREFVDSTPQPGQPYKYHLRLVLQDGSELEPPAASVFTPSAVAALEQNFPNPFNPTTSIAYVVPEGGAHVILRILDVRGRLVRSLVHGFIPGGRWIQPWDGTDAQGVRVASGTYLVRLEAGASTHTRRITLLK